MEERPVPIQLRWRGAALDRPLLCLLIRHCLEQEGAEQGLGAGVVIAGDRFVRGLNLRYRGIDRTTDVLSFEDTGGRLGDEAALVGEIVISGPRCLRQAEEQGVRPGVELARLVIHGVLHLLGHDHERPRDRARMVPREVRHRGWARRQQIGPHLFEPRQTP